MDRFVIISGCSGGGKSTLIGELARRGHATMPEPGRRIVRQELEGDGAALPWVDALAFTRRAIAMARADLAAAEAQRARWVFFDRSLVDAAAALEHLIGTPAAETLNPRPAYHRRVFLTPPWPEIYRTDDERRHGLEAAVPEYECLLQIYPRLGFEVVLAPKMGVEARADFVLRALGDP